MGGRFHVVQLWVNLPPALKMTTPRYQSITSDSLRLLTSHDGGALIRLIAGDIAGFDGPGVTHTPITYAHVDPGSRRAARVAVEPRRSAPSSSCSPAAAASAPRTGRSKTASSPCSAPAITSS